MQTDNFTASDYATERLTVGPVKIVADGSIQGYTGYLSQPYHVPYHGDEGFESRVFGPVPEGAPVTWHGPYGTVTP